MANWRVKALILVLAWLLAALPAAGHVRIIHLTDPHLWDGGDADDNREALRVAIDKINLLHAREAAPYDFVVVTGDLGIEKLPDATFDAGVDFVAGQIARSRVMTWYFVPGNNDLTDEEPSTIHRYRRFIKQLKTKLPSHQVADLSAPATTPPVIEGRCFVGVDNASFKNNNKPDRVRKTARGQLDVLEDTDKRLSACGSAYLFLHIPETDDPWGAGDGAAKFLKDRYPNEPKPHDAFAFSSWLVDPSVRARWDKIVVDPRVKAIFAGHYHDFRRSTYEDFRWMRTGVYRSASVTKTFICPPLAIKRQKEQATTARGFAEIVIDADGKVARRVFWYLSGDNQRPSFEPAGGPADDAELRQLQLGKAFETINELDAARKSYETAALSADPLTRRDATAGIGRIVARQRKGRLELYVIAPLRSAWTTTAPALFPLLALALLAIVTALFKGPVGRWRGRRRMVIGTIMDVGSAERAATLRSALADAYRVYNLQPAPRIIRPVVAAGVVGGLPVLILGDPPPVVELIEIGSPTAARILAWLSKQLHNPEYVLEASLLSTAGGVLAAVRLMRWGNLHAQWSDTLATHFAQDCASFAFAVVVDLRHHI